MNSQADRLLGQNLGNFLFQRLAEFQQVCARLHPDRERDGGLAVEAKQRRWRIGVAARDGCHICQWEEPVVDPEIDRLQAFLRYELTVDPHADALWSLLEYTRGRDGILRLQRGDDGTGVEAERRDFPRRKFQENLFILRAENVDLADIRDGQDFCANVLDAIAQLALGQAVAGESVDVAEDVAEAVVEAGSYDPLREVALDVRNHVADARPDRRDVGSLRRVAQIDEDGCLARNGDALGIVERLQLFELLLDPVGDLARHFLGRSARPLRPDHHGLDGEIRIFLPPQLQVCEQTGRHEGDHEIPDKRAMSECPVGEVERFHGVESCSKRTCCPCVRLWIPAVTMRAPTVRPPVRRMPPSSSESSTLRSETVLVGASMIQTKVSAPSLRTADAGTRRTEL